MQLHVTTHVWTGGCDLGQRSQRTISTCDSVAPSHAQGPVAYVTERERDTTRRCFGSCIDLVALQGCRHAREQGM